MNETARVQLTLPSHPRFMRYVRVLVAQGARDAGFDEETTQAIVLAVDEACTNVIRHAYRGATDEMILVYLNVDGPKLTIALRDFGPQQDCSKFQSRDLDDIKPGGLGMHFIRTTMDEVVFDTDLPRGTLLTLTKTCKPAATEDPRDGDH